MPEVRWDKGGTQPADSLYIFLCKWKWELWIGQDVSYIWKSYQHLKGQSLLVTRCHIILKHCWCDDIVLSMHALTENKVDNAKDSFYGEEEYIFNQFPKYENSVRESSLPE